jgi:hypothetical protein
LWPPVARRRPDRTGTRPSSPTRRVNHPRGSPDGRAAPRSGEPWHTRRLAPQPVTPHRGPARHGWWPRRSTSEASDLGSACYFANAEPAAAFLSMLMR